MDVMKIAKDVAKLIEDFGVVAVDVKVLIDDLTAAGIDPQKFFARYAVPQATSAEQVFIPLELVVSPDWRKMIDLLVKYGPIVYAILAKMFGWPTLLTSAGVKA
jgi:hypothetical protein